MPPELGDKDTNNDNSFLFFENPTKSVYQLHALRKDFQKSEQKIPTTPMTPLYYRLLN